MKKLFLLFTLFVFVFFAKAQTSSTTTPCNDPMYLELQKKGVANLTETEMTYYNKMKNECDQLNKKETTSVLAASVLLANQAIDQKHKQEKALKNNNVKMWAKFWFWTAAIVGLLVYGSQQKW